MMWHPMNDQGCLHLELSTPTSKPLHKGETINKTLDLEGDDIRIMASCKEEPPDDPDGLRTLSAADLQD